MTRPTSSTAWTADIALRMRRMFPLKFAGTSVVIWVFFVGYFHVLKHPAHAVLQMPLTPLDAWIPFQPTMLVPYLSLWLYVGLAPGLQLTLRELLVYGLWCVALGATGLLIFYFWPTAVPPAAIDVSGHAGFRMLQGVDAAGNACPSMHVAFAMFSALWVDHLLRSAGVPALLRAGNYAWFAVIAWSTIAIRQHVVLDVVAGAALGAVFALASLRWRPRVGGLERHGAAAIIKGMRADIAP